MASSPRMALSPLAPGHSRPASRPSAGPATCAGWGCRGAGGGSHRSSTVPPSGAGPPDSSLPPHPMRSPTTALSPDETRVPRHCAPRSQEPLSQTHLPEGQRGDTWRPEIPYPRLCDTRVGGAGHLRVRPAAQGPSALRRKSWPRPPQPQGRSTFCPCRFASSACSHVESHHSRPRGPFVKAPPSVLSLGSWGDLAFSVLL